MGTLEHMQRPATTTYAHGGREHLLRAAAIAALAWTIAFASACTRAIAPAESTARGEASLALAPAPSASATGVTPAPDLAAHQRVTPVVPSPVESSTLPAAGSAPAAERRASSDGGDDDEMILVPAGMFRMGADSGGQDDERPAHDVTLPAFWLDRTEVTNRAYATCVSAGVCRAHDPASAEKNHFGPDTVFRAPEQPISSISWDDARAFCGFRGKRLPREAEWERAARGDGGRRYPWGDEAPSPQRAVYGSSRTLAVGSRPDGAGPYGHLDMAGNVWEWLEDVYDPYGYRREQSARGLGGDCRDALAAQDELRRLGRQGYTGSNPLPTTCERVLRGGAFNYDAPGLRSSNRVHHPPQFRLIMSGVRCARDARS
jgi:formylglycine-generating enzyme required for sulfatase activity